jgi:hypothetical protein
MPIANASFDEVFTRLFMLDKNGHILKVGDGVRILKWNMLVRNDCSFTNWRIEGL